MYLKDLKANQSFRGFCQNGGVNILKIILNIVEKVLEKISGDQNFNFIDV